MLRPYVQTDARGWFSVDIPGKDSQSYASSPCQEADHLLVPVIAFYLILVYLSTYTVGETGLEPATSAMSKQCSNQLSYPPEGFVL
jgi:hypothetical protein